MSDSSFIVTIERQVMAADAQQASQQVRATLRDADILAVVTRVRAESALRDAPLPEGTLREDAGDSMDTAHRWVRQDHADQISMDRNNLTLWALGKHQMDLGTVRETILRLDQNLQQVDL